MVGLQSVVPCTLLLITLVGMEVTSHTYSQLMDQFINLSMTLEAKRGWIILMIFS